MVVSPNAHDSLTPIAQRLADLESKIEEIGRANKYPFSISPAGQDHFVVAPADPDNVGTGAANITIGAGDGTPLIRSQVNPYNNSKQTYYVYDPAGSVVLAPDNKAGYGLAVPSFNVPLYPDYAGYSNSTNSIGSSNYNAWHGEFFIWTPRIYVAWISRCSGGGTASSWLRLQYGTTDTTTTAQTGGDATVYTATYSFAQADIGRYCVLTLWVSNPAATGTTFVVPQASTQLGS